MPITFSPSTANVQMSEQPASAVQRMKLSTREATPNQPPQPQPSQNTPVETRCSRRSRGRSQPSARGAPPLVAIPFSTTHSARSGCRTDSAWHHDVSPSACGGTSQMARTNRPVAPPVDARVPRDPQRVAGDRVIPIEAHGAEGRLVRRCVDGFEHPARGGPARHGADALEESPVTNALGRAVGTEGGEETPQRQFAGVLGESTALCRARRLSM